MAKEKTTRDIDDKTQPASCPRSYKPWVWTLVIMALVTLIWALYEGYQGRGVIRSLAEGKGEEALTKGQKYGVIFKSGGVNAATPVQNLQSSYHGIIENVRPAVISIDAVITRMPMNNAGIPEINYNRIGSGVIIDPRGYVLSSYHVIEGANSLRSVVYGAGGSQEYPLRVVNAYKNTDLVLLRILADGPFEYAVLGNSDSLRTGDVVLAMGSPFGFDQTITAGIISSRHRTINIGGTLYEDVIQTDTPINKGNSGGPLVNVNGEVVGINTAIYSPTGAFSGIGFSIPINKAETLVAGVLDFRNSPAQVAQGQIVAWSSRGNQMGNSFKLPNGQIITPPHKYRGECLECHPQLVTQPVNELGLPWQKMDKFKAHVGTLEPWQKMDRFKYLAAAQGVNVEPSIGVSLMEVNSVIARQFGMVHAKGVLVEQVYTGSPAEQAGITRGDIIYRVDGRKVQNLDDFIKYTGSKKIGEKLKLVLLSNGKRKKVKVGTAAATSFIPARKMRANVRQRAEFDWFGAEISPINATLKPYVHSGVYVADVEGVLAAAGVQRGDVIKSINRREVIDMTSFITMSQKVDIRKGFLLDIIRSGRPVYVVVKG